MREMLIRNEFPQAFSCEEDGPGRNKQVVMDEAVRLAGDAMEGSKRFFDAWWTSYVLSKNAAE
jgi:hypothetical protein